jgi:DUF4097 and DUF4098 domain-containing protein YvlB
MKTLPLLLLLTTALPLAAMTEETIDRRFAMPANGQLVVDIRSGSIEIATHASNEIVVSAVRKITRRSKALEEEYLNENPVTLTQDGSTLTIQETRGRNIASGFWLFGVSRTECRYTVTVPASFNTRLKTSGGGITVSDLTGAVKANTSGGGLRFARVRGPIDGHTSGGGIRVADCEGTIKIDTSGGGIDVNGGSGDLDGDTSGGSVSVKNFRGPVLVETSGGGITIENVVGRIDGHTSGGSISARFATPIADAVKLHTSGGGVTFRVPEGAAFHLDASTSGGGVSSDLPVTVVGKISRGKLAGAINGGGQPVVLRSSGGSIAVKKLQ